MNMVVLNRATLPDGTLIRLEDWSADFSFYPYGAMVAAYPKRYMRRRAEAEFKNHADAAKAFSQLATGKVDIIDIDFTVMDPGGNRVLLKPILFELRRRAHWR